jgi:hypothetical protein
MRVSLKTAFSILDGRLSTNINDVYEMLNYVFDTELMSHQIPVGINKLIETNPDWFEEGIILIADIKRKNNTNDFKELIELIDINYSDHYIKLGKVESKISFVDGLL